MPTALLNAHATEMNRISAVESLLEAERLGVGTGSLKRGARQRIARGWERAAQQERVVLRPKTRAAYQAHMAMAGITVKKAVKSDG